MNRRRAVVAIGLGLAGSPALLRGRYQVFAQSQARYSARCVKLMEENLVVDLLNQFRFPDFRERPPRINRWLTQNGSLSAEDAAIYRGSGLTALATGHGADNYESAINTSWRLPPLGRDSCSMKMNPNSAKT
jgi:hypothetical protein